MAAFDLAAVVHHDPNIENRMRLYRDWLLQQSDWAMAPDAPTDKEAWAAYRQALRDFPTTWDGNAVADFPEAPNAD
jgi:hypothetical protein